MIAGFLPPISMISGRGTGRAALSRISFKPTSFEPVKTMPSMPSLSISSWPAVDPGPVTKLNTPRGKPASIAISLSLRAHERRVAGRLEDDGVAGRQRAARRSCRERERKIERRDDRPDAVRPQHAHVVFARAERAHLLDETVVLFDLIAIVRNEIGRLFDITDAFEPVLADLVPHERRQLASMISNGVGDSAHVHEPLLPRQRGPRRIGGARRRHRRPHVILRALLKMPEQNAGIDRTAILELRVGFDGLAVDVEEMLAAERLRSVGDGFVERAVKIVERVATKGGVSDLGRHGSY